MKDIFLVAKISIFFRKAGNYKIDSSNI